jgi:hypothetical protein
MHGRIGIRDETIMYCAKQRAKIDRYILLYLSI